MKIQYSLSAVLGAFALAAGLSTIAPGTASAQQQSPTNSWFKVCAKQEENDICNVQYQSRAGNGQLVTAISFLTITGKVNRQMLQVTVPIGRLIPAGVKVQVDDKKEVTIPYYICRPQDCIASIPYNEETVSLFKGGGELTVTSTNFQSRPNPVKITLEGFTAAFDGPGLKQDELQARQRQLQEELRKRAEEQRKKLQEAQEKAKGDGE